MSDIVAEYREAYTLLHGEPPVIRRNGSWILIGDCPDWMALKCRKSDLPGMTSQLKYWISIKDCA